MWKEPHLTQIRQKKKELKSQGEEGRMWDEGPQDWMIKTHSAGCLQLLDHPGLSGWFGKPWCLVTKSNSRNWLYLEWGRSLESWGECRHSTLWRGGGKHEGSRALTRLCTLLRREPTKPRQRTRKNCSGYYFSDDLAATGRFLWKRSSSYREITHSSTGVTIVPCSDLVEKRSSLWLTCRRQSFFSEMTWAFSSLESSISLDLVPTKKRTGISIVSLSTTFSI